MSVRAAQQGPCAVAERRRGSQRHQRVHVGGTHLQLPPRAGIKLRSADRLHHARQNKRQPLKPRRHAEPQNPFAHHQDAGDAQPQNQIPLPMALFGRCFAGLGDGHFLRGEARAGDGRDDGGKIYFSGRIPADGGASAGDIGGNAVNSRHFPRRFHDFSGTVVASHAADLEIGGRTGTGLVRFQSWSWHDNIVSPSAGGGARLISNRRAPPEQACWKVPQIVRGGNLRSICRLSRSAEHCSASLNSCNRLQQSADTQTTRFQNRNTQSGCSALRHPAYLTESSRVMPNFSIRLRRVARVMPSSLAAFTWLSFVSFSA